MFGHSIVLTIPIAIARIKHSGGNSSCTTLYELLYFFVETPMENKISKSPRVNYWMISTLLFGFLFFLTTGVNLLSQKTTSNIKPLPNTTISSTKPPDKASFRGTVKTGAQLGEIKGYCPDGLYLVAEEGKFLVDQATILQLRLPNQPDGTKMLADQKYVGQKVKVAGQYPAQEVFCEALLCECDDYLLVENINSAE